MEDLEPKEGPVVSSTKPDEITKLVVADNSPPGSLGSTFNLRVNHIPIKISKGRTIFYRYHVDVESERGDSIRDMTLCRALARSWSRQENSPLYKKPYVYDAAHLMFFTQSLEKDYYAESITIRDDGPYSSGGLRTLKVSLKAAGKIDLSKLISNTRISGYGPQDIMSALQFVNVSLRHFPSQSHFTVAGSMFSMEDSSMIIPLGDTGVNLHIGSYTSCRLLSSGLALNIDVSNSTMYSPGSVLSIVGKITRQRIEPNISIPQEHYDDVMNHFYGLKINYAFPGGMKRSCRVYGISKLSISEIEFMYEDAPITVKKYFENKYDCKFTYPNLQCFNSSNKPNGESWMPIEYATIVQRQLYRKTLEAAQARKMIDLTCQTPSLRLEKIRSAYERFKSPDKLYSEFSLQPTAEFITVKARKLPAESLKFGKNSKIPIVTPINGFWNLNDKKLVRAGHLKVWSVVVYHSKSSMPDVVVDKFVNTLLETLRNLDISVSPPQDIHRFPEVTRDPSSISRLLSNAFSGKQDSIALLLVILPSHRETEVYSATKLVGDATLGIPSQCVLAKNVSKADVNTCKNIALKINLKLKGTNCVLNSKLEFISSSPTMIIGADVSHPERNQGIVKSVSVASVVGSMNSTCTAYAVSTKPQIPNTESFSVLQEQIADILKEFVHKNRVTPQNIIYYRDGVSEGDISYATRAEINGILIAAHAIKSGWRPRITYISCNKRHHTRFFPTDADIRRSMGASKLNRFTPQDFPCQNVPPGTVVDTAITNVGFKNFYIVPHCGLKGTSRPVHYQVLHDENDLSLDRLERLTYQLSHLYGRSSSIVSYVAPVYYAHTVSRRASVWYSAKAKMSPMLSSSTARMDDSGVKMVGRIELHPRLNDKLWFV